MANPKIEICEDNNCILVAQEDLAENSGNTLSGQFNQVIADIVTVYPTAILVGAAAAAQYIGPANEPRITYDVDVILDEKDFEDFLMDEIPKEVETRLDSLFDNSDSTSHSLKHKETGMYVDLLSLASKPVRKKIVRHILNNREKTTNTYQIGDRSIAILKPEYLIAMKLNRYAKLPRSERGLCDRVDIMKVLKALKNTEVIIDETAIKTFCNDNENQCYLNICDDVTCELPEEEQK